MSHQDNEKNKRLRETIKSLPPMTRDTAERARELQKAVVDAACYSCYCNRVGGYVCGVHKALREYETQIQAEARLEEHTLMCEDCEYITSGFTRCNRGRELEKALAQALQLEERKGT